MRGVNELLEGVVGWRNHCSVSKLRLEILLIPSVVVDRMLVLRMMCLAVVVIGMMVGLRGSGKWSRDWGDGATTGHHGGTSFGVGFVR